MRIAEGIHRAIDFLTELPGATQIRVRRYEAHFAAHTGHNIYRGIYSSYAEALRSAPSTKPIGYDNSDSATIYLERTDRILPSDYPVLFWLQKLWLDGCTSVFDLGGNIGVSYRAYRRLATYPASLRWVVHDVPTIVKLGRQWVSENDAQGHLSFTDDPADATGADILLANGALQYLPYELHQLLGELNKLPTHLLVNRLPLHPAQSFFTLQSTGFAFCPYRVLSEARFVTSLVALGYSVVDRWKVPELNCHIPFAPERSFNGYQGFFLSLDPRRGPLWLAT
jgi:putative methyltransferase (TIGR04325 family)